MHNNKSREAHTHTLRVHSNKLPISVEACTNDERRQWDAHGNIGTALIGLHERNNTFYAANV